MPEHRDEEGRVRIPLPRREPAGEQARRADLSGKAAEVPLPDGAANSAVTRVLRGGAGAMPTAVAAAATVSGNAAIARMLRGTGVQRSALGVQDAGPLDPRTGAAIKAERGGGAPLPDPVRADMEQRLGADLTSVRVHTGSAADGLARAVTAEAFTSGTDVFIPGGRYDPVGTAGRELLAHELTHVARHHTGDGQARVSHPDEPAEVEARAVARQVAHGAPVALPPGPPPAGTRRDAAVRREADGTGPSPTTLHMRDPLDDLRVSLEQAGRGPLWAILAGLPHVESPPEPVLQLLPTLDPDRRAPKRTQVIFGPLSSDEALRLLTQSPQKPGWVDRMLRPESLEEQAAAESGTDVYIVYTNDGKGFGLNQGSNTDQGYTAGLEAHAEFNKHDTGLSRFGLTVIGMTTPRGTLPPGAPVGPQSTYQTPKGPYSGVLAADIGVTVSRSGGSVVDFILSAGIDSREWGELVQDTIHDLSKSPKFPWPSGTKPLLEGGLTWKHTIDDLVAENFAGLSYTGRLELNASAITGTHRTEADAGARFVVRTARMHTSAGEIWVEFSPVGAFARGFLRYNDGREEGIAGVEAGVNSSLMVNVGRFGVGLRGEAIMSTDPAFQTDTPAGSHPTALKISPFVDRDFGMPAGHHGIGQVVFKISF